MNWSDWKRLIAPIQKKIFLLLGRAILTAVNNEEGTQKIQITVMNNETITDVERFQEYGLETYPLIDAEAFSIFLNGNRDHGIVLCVHDRRYRPKDLVKGEVALYTDEDQLDGKHRAHLKRGQIFEIKNKQLIIHSAEKVEINTVNANVKCEGKASVTALGGVNIAGSDGDVKGVVQGDCICALTGGPHSDFSSNVKATK